MVGGGDVGGCVGDGFGGVFVASRVVLGRHRRGAYEIAMPRPNDASGSGVIDVTGVWSIGVLTRVNGKGEVVYASSYFNGIAGADAGWGEMTFLGELFPQAKQVAFAEFYYHGQGYDVGFDTEFIPVDDETPFRTKAKNVIALSQLLIERHGGEVPHTHAELQDLPGVGRKTANVVLGNAFGIQAGMPVSVQIHPYGSGAVEIFPAFRIDEVRSFALFDDEGCLLLPLLHLRKRMPQVGVIPGRE